MPARLTFIALWPPHGKDLRSIALVCSLSAMKMTATIPSFRISSELKKQLGEAAKELGGRRSYAIRQALQIGVPELLKRMRAQVPDYPPGSLAHLCTPERDAEMLAIHRATSHVPARED